MELRGFVRPSVRATACPQGHLPGYVCICLCAQTRLCPKASSSVLGEDAGLCPLTGADGASRPVDLSPRFHPAPQKPRVPSAGQEQPVLWPPEGSCHTSPARVPSPGYGDVLGGGARVPPRTAPPTPCLPPQTCSRWRSPRPIWPGRRTRSACSRRTWSWFWSRRTVSVTGHAGAGGRPGPQGRSPPAPRGSRAHGWRQRTLHPAPQAQFPQLLTVGPVQGPPRHPSFGVSSSAPESGSESRSLSLCVLSGRGGACSRLHRACSAVWRGCSP